MRKMLNGFTNTEMFVADDRVDEYLAAGHVLAADPPVTKKAETVKEEPKAEPVKAEPKKAPAKKTVAKVAKKATKK